MRDLIKAAGEIRLVAVGEMSAVRKVHRENSIARLQHGKIDRHVRLRAAVRLDVEVLPAEELPCAIEGELLDDIDVFTTAVPAAAGVALRVFVGEH